MRIPDSRSALWRESLIPNALSGSRILLGLAFPFVPNDWRMWVVILAAISDGLDGLAARWLRSESNTGRLLDPIADKVFILMLVGTLLVEGTFDPLWALGLAARDIIVLAGLTYTIARRRWSIGRKMRPSLLGKTTTAAQFAVLLVLLAWGEVPLWLLAAVTALSVLAALDYLRVFRRLHAGEGGPPANE